MKILSDTTIENDPANGYARYRLFIDTSPGQNETHIRNALEYQDENLTYRILGIYKMKPSKGFESLPDRYIV